MKWKRQLFIAAAQHQVDALAIMTISDSLVNPDEDTTAEERQNTFTDMMKVGLEHLFLISCYNERTPLVFLLVLLGYS